MRRIPPARYARAFIIVFTFPPDPAGVDDYLGDDLREMRTVVDEILAPDEDLYFTTPRWAERGDVCFFYYAKSAVPNIRSVQRREEREGGMGSLREEYFDRALEQARRYGGRIFASGVIARRAEPEPHSPGAHWRTRSYCWIDERAALPLVDLLAHADRLPVSHGQSTLPLSAAQFRALLSILEQSGRPLPASLLNVIPLTETLLNVTPENWRELACSPAQRFKSEAEIRAALIDHLLDEIKDPETKIYREVWCSSPSTTRSRVDYLVSLGGVWVPVEAKLNILTESDLRRQVDRYLSATLMSVGPRRGETVNIGGVYGNVCLVVDQTGIFMLNREGFVKCLHDRPLISRPEIGKRSAAEVRRKLARAASENRQRGGSRS